MANNKKIYPDPKNEPWTGITEEELEKGGFINDGTNGYIHPKCKDIGVMRGYKGQWGIYHVPDGNNFILMRKVQYMYQIDNMFHGFTDRWLGYI